MRKTKRYLLLIISLLLAACSVGPDYVKPTAVEKMPAAFKELKGWKVAQPDGHIPARWWELYNDQDLNTLVQQVVVSNQTIASAEARYRQARAQVRAARAGYYPTLSAGASANYSRRSENLGGSGRSSSASWDLQIPVDLTWELDLWGRIRRSVEAGEANLQATAADLAGVVLSMQAELATAYFQLRMIDAQRQLYDATIGVFQKSLDLTRNRYTAGVAAKADVLQAEAQLKSTQAQALDLGVQRAELEHAIALLTGKPPATFSLPVSPFIAAFPDIPAGVPSELLERRPDIASAERRMAAANAEIGIAKAAYYPAVRLSATAGLESSSLATLFTWPSRFWSVGPVLAQTLFDGGLRRAQVEQTEAAYDAIVADYRQIVLNGFKEVEDNLAALRMLEEESQVQDQAVQAAQQVVKITTNQYQAGTAAYLNVLVAQSTALANDRTALTILGRRLTASVQLIKALGGGWRVERKESDKLATTDEKLEKAGSHGGAEN